MREEEVDTPALLLDLDAFEHNLDRMAALLEPTGAQLRAHAKTHKSPVIARLQMARAARSGSACRRWRRPRSLAWGGVPDILVSNEVVGARKLARLAALSRIARVAVCADDAAQVAAYEAAAEAAGIRLDVLVEIDVGAGRCGVEPGPPAVALAERIAASRAPPLRRPPGLPRQRPAPARAGRAGGGDRRRRRGDAPHRGAAPPARAGLRHRRRRRHRHLRAGGRRAACSPRSRPAPTPSWTPTTPATRRRRPSASRSSCWRR